MFCAGMSFCLSAALGQSQDEERKKAEAKFGVKLKSELLKSGATYRDAKTFKKTNTAAWQSETHGKWFVDIFVARNVMEAYDALKPIPEGGTVVKQGYAAEADAKAGKPTGPVFVMKRMPKGYDAKYGDWYFALAFPNERGDKFFLFGDGKDSSIAYCKSCHSDASGTVGTFGAPKSPRVK